MPWGRHLGGYPARSSWGGYLPRGVPCQGTLPGGCTLLGVPCWWVPCWGVGGTLQGGTLLGDYPDGWVTLPGGIPCRGYPIRVHPWPGQDVGGYPAWGRYPGRVPPQQGTPLARSGWGVSCLGGYSGRVPPGRVPPQPGQHGGYPAGGGGVPS